MKFVTNDTAKVWCKQHAIALTQGLIPSVEGSGFKTEYFCIPSAAERLLWFSQFISSTLQPWTRCLLWVTGSGIWSSSENWHLYYRLRQSYSDFGYLEDAPGHLFLAHERSDFITFVHLCLSFGWDAHLLPFEGYSRVFISHDGWIAFSMKDVIEFERIERELTKANIDKYTRP